MGLWGTAGGVYEKKDQASGWD